MPKRILLPILALASLLLWLAPVHAQASWQALLYDRASGRVARVNDSGASEEFTLPAIPGYELYPDRVAVGHGGGPIAYIPINQSTRDGQLVVVNTGEATPLFTYPLPQRLLDSLLLRASENNFAPDNRSLAFGYSLLGGGWELVLFDLTTGAPATSLRSDNPLVTVLGLPVTGGYVPVVERYTGELVAFSLVPEGAETAQGWSSYLWNVTTGNITGDIAYPTQDNDTLVATGEVVLAMPDERLPNTSSAFTFGQSNALHVYDPVQNARYPFYSASNLTFFRPTFVQGGERILTEADDAANTHIWQLVERSGALVAEAVAPQYVNSVVGVADGFLYTAASPGAATTTLFSVNTRGGLNAGVPVWSNTTSESWRIVWVGGAQLSALGALTGWAQLATPVTGTGGSLGGVTLDAGGGSVIVAPLDVPTIAPASGGILVVGGQASINTTEGDTLNVRAGPGTSYEIVARLPDGARVTLLEGPRAGEGYTWWRIRAGNTEGWVVESVDDRGTRLQTLIP